MLALLRVGWMTVLLTEGVRVRAFPVTVIGLDDEPRCVACEGVGVIRAASPLAPFWGLSEMGLAAGRPAHPAKGECGYTAVRRGHAHDRHANRA